MVKKINNFCYDEERFFVDLKRLHRFVLIGTMIAVFKIVFAIEWKKARGVRFNICFFLLISLANLFFSSYYFQPLTKFEILNKSLCTQTIFGVFAKHTRLYTDMGDIQKLKVQSVASIFVLYWQCSRIRHLFQHLPMKFA